MSFRDIETRIAGNNQEIQKMRDQSYLLTININFDNVVLNFLKEKLGFDYAAEKAKIDKVVTENRTRIDQLIKENESLQNQVTDISYTEKLAAAKITFQGTNLKLFSGDAVTIDCPQCKNTFTKNLRNIRTLTSEPNLDYLINAKTLEEYQKFIGYDYHKFKVYCPSCNFMSIVYASRSF